ncbi:MAG: hypothetical protein M3P83_04395 [Actinomycetota bacterium]|nr:hypothetical protein [Actinomycetota bacterium]
MRDAPLVRDGRSDSTGDVTAIGSVNPRVDRIESSLDVEDVAVLIVANPTDEAVVVVTEQLSHR